MLSNTVREVAADIGMYYLVKNNQDYTDCREEILSLRITNLDVIGDEVWITTSRPGLLIGKKGKNIEDLASYLKMKIRIKEDIDCLIDSIIPQDYRDFEGSYISFVG